MRLWLATLFRQWADALDPPPDLGLLITAAMPLIKAQNAYTDRSGEAKRHQVYASLIDQFPKVPRRLLSRAIEDALNVS